MNKDHLTKTDVCINFTVAGMPPKSIYVNAQTLTKANAKKWLKMNGDYFFERFGYHPNNEQRVAFICSDVACAYAAGNNAAFKESAAWIATAARTVGLLECGKLHIYIVKADPRSNLVQTAFQSITPEQYENGFMGGLAA